jgi:hypothetical protein
LAGLLFARSSLIVAAPRIAVPVVGLVVLSVVLGLMGGQEAEVGTIDWR